MNVGDKFDDLHPMDGVACEHRHLWLVVAVPPPDVLPVCHNQ